MKQKLLILRGISGSGKTTLAKELERNGWVRVEKDEIRLDTRIFPNGYKYPKDESRVVQERDRMVRQALKDGRNVVCSDTNLAPKHIKQLQAIGRQCGADVEVDESFLQVPLKELIQRDRNRENSVGPGVIRKQFHDFVKTMPTFLQYDPELQWCIVSDLDGTLTNGPKDRSPYDWSKVGNDEINLGVAKILDGIKVLNLSGTDLVHIFLFSGRLETCRPETEDWLEKNDVEYDELHMRPKDREFDKDYEIKRSFLFDNIVGKYNILFWLDDRPQVADMLRDEYGINVLQRGDPHHSF